MSKSPSGELTKLRSMRVRSVPSASLFFENCWVDNTKVIAAATNECQVDQEIVKKFGSHNIRRSRAHTGSGWRVQQKLLAASRGEPLKVALIGGSGKVPRHSTVAVAGTEAKSIPSIDRTWLDTRKR